MGTRSSGLYLISKLKFEHINLTPFSRMRVDLAAQVSILRIDAFTIQTLTGAEQINC